MINLNKSKKILVLISGSIACIKTPLIVSDLSKTGMTIKCVITESAKKLVSQISLSILSRNKCYSDIDFWDSDQTKPLHIELAEWADIILIAPLSASSLSRWATGLSEGLVANILLATKKPIIAIPAMNTQMWTNSATQTNWERITSYKNVLGIPPSKGLLACDNYGTGKMAPIELINLAIMSSLISIEKGIPISGDLKNTSFLISAGATKEELDAARTLTNRSSGEMGLMIAQAAKLRGAKVYFVYTDIQFPVEFAEGLIIKHVSSGLSMQSAMEDFQKQSDIVVMAAAITDLRNPIQPREPIKTPKSDLKELLFKDLELVPDILKKMIKTKKKNQKFVGFCAFTGDFETAKKLALKKKQSKGCDFLFANPVDQPEQGFGKNNFNKGWLFEPDGNIVHFELASKLEIAHELLNRITK
tara:strand:+ start:11855 stop:13108 length:1254 start_codon:yes stop_codon:yes gene_type:complete